MKIEPKEELISKQGKQSILSRGAKTTFADTRENTSLKNIMHHKTDMSAKRKKKNYSGPLLKIHSEEEDCKFHEELEAEPLPKSRT